MQHMRNEYFRIWGFLMTNILSFIWIFSDSNNIILWHESQDTNKDSLIPILSLQVMHEFVWKFCIAIFC